MFTWPELTLLGGSISKVETLPHLVLDRDVALYSYIEKVCRKNVHATIPKGNMGYDQYSVPDFVGVEPTVVAFLQHSQTYVHGLACHSIPTFFEEQ